MKIHSTASEMTSVSSLIAVLLLVGLPLAGAEWPEFRGPWGNGQAAAPGDTAPAGLPLRWNETENIKWKTPLPERGWSTPVVLGGQIWLTTAALDGHDFFAVCLDAERGQILFNEKLFHADKPEPLNNNVNCYASPSPVIEPGRVYISFGSYGTACLDTATRKVLWERRDLPCCHYRGPGSSPILFEDLLILTLDGVDVQYVAALDKKTGQTVWKTDRTAEWNDLDAQGKPTMEGDYRKAFSTPLLVDVNGKTELLSAGSRAVYGYDPKTGRELWKVSHGGYSSAARPVYGQGLAFIMTGQGQPGLIAVRADGAGDVTKTHLVWKTNQGAPKMPSPLLVHNLLYMVSDDGGVACLEAATGNVVWKERIGGTYCASPIYADERIYIPSLQGTTTVIKAGRKFEVLATNKLEAGCMASPAVAGKALFLRTKTHLYRIEAAAGGK